MLPSLFQKMSLAVLVLGSMGCAAQSAAPWRQATPVFEPLDYFNGQTHSWGVFENRAGEPTSTLRTFTRSRREGEVLHFEQDIVFESGKKTHRSWLIRRVGRGQYVATGTGIVGEAKGETVGNRFHIRFTLDAIPGNPLGHVQMTQWLYLQSDGKTVINRDTVKKAGILVAEATEYFHKDR